MHAEQPAYYRKCREKLATLPRGSKQSWSLSKRLLRKNASPAFFPPLKSADGTWHREPDDKAAMLAKTFNKKFELPPERHELPFVGGQPRLSEFNCIRVRHVEPSGLITP